MGFLKLAAGVAVGYVLGSRAGREKYENIAATARKVGEHPTVVQAQEKAKALIGTGTDKVNAKLSEAAASASATTPSSTSSTSSASSPAKSTSTSSTTSPAKSTSTSSTTSPAKSTSTSSSSSPSPSVVAKKSSSTQPTTEFGVATEPLR